MGETSETNNILKSEGERRSRLRSIYILSIFNERTNGDKQSMRCLVRRALLYAHSLFPR
jgi:hypothetical protein